ncbi:MAG TPA: IclR family transcriptional regulator [Solirubrobacterales bacterium]|nr:IclR family transcriptional regulator [Solirubrobacterales bacterium]
MTEKAEASSQQGIKSIEVGARVLRALERGRGPMSLSEVAKGADLHPAKAHRYLTSLTRTGLASQDTASGLYDLGSAARALGVEAVRRADSVRTASAFAVELRDETGHTVNTSVWSEGGPVLVGWDTGAHLLPIVIRLGSTLPMLDSAVGLVFLANLPKAATAPVVKAQQKQGATREMPAAAVEELRRAGRDEPFARTVNQMIFGLAALAAPVFGPGGEIELALGLVLPGGMASEREMDRLGAQVRAAADRASQELGFSG